MKVASKIALGSGSLLLVFAGAMTHQLALVRGLANAQRDFSTAKIRAARIAFDQIRQLEEMDESVRKLYVTEDAQYGVKIERLRRRFSDGLAELGELGLDGDEETALERLGAAWQDLPTTTTSGEATSLVAPLRRLRGETERFLDAVEGAIERQAGEAAAASETAGRIALAVVAVALASSLLVVRLTVRSIHQPLHRLTEGTRAVAEGQFDLELDTSQADEFSRLAEDFNAMVRRLGELDDVKKDLLSHVSHELKTPLATMQETQQILLEEIPGSLNGQQRRLLELNLKSSGRLSRLISKLLDLSRLEAGVMAYDFARRDVAPLVSDAVEELMPRARERGVEIETRLPEEPLELDCDGDRLVQVFENLIENAIKFSPEGGEVGVEVRSVALPAGSVSAGSVSAGSVSAGSAPTEDRPAGRLPSALYGGDGAYAVLVAVSDAGPGVPDDEKKKIFQKFHQAGPRKGGSVGGAGLGLAICRSLVEAHQGTIWVTDRPQGGSVFRLLLPAARR